MQDPQYLASRRFMDLVYAVVDHHDRCEELEHALESSDTRATAAFSASCGYVLRLELRKRTKHVETGFTLLEPGLGLHTPLIRLYRRSVGGPWLCFHANLAHGSREMQRLCRSIGLDEPSKRYECTDFVANMIFGKSCQMMLYGFMSR